MESAAAGKAAAPARNWRRTLVRGVLLYLVTPYLAVLVLVFLFQRWLIYQPTKTSRLLARDVAAPGETIEDVALHAAEGLTLHGWRFRSPLVVPDDERLLVLYFPGNAGCRRDRVADCRDFTALGCDVLLFDYRGYGDNGGAPREELLAADARRAWICATQELQVPPERLVLFGESLGGAVATRLAAEFSQAGQPPRALILNSTFCSLGDVAAWHYPLFPFRYLLWDRFPSVTRIGRVGCRVLQFHGTADDIVPIEQGRKLFAATSAVPGGAHRFVEIPDGRHNFISMSDMHTAVSALLAELRHDRTGEQETR